MDVTSVTSASASVQASIRALESAVEVQAEAILALLQSLGLGQNIDIVA